MKQVLAIIVSYNFEPWLSKCLDSLLQSSYPMNVMVIDNASTDNTVARIQQEYPLVILQQNERNLGFGQANNLGFAYAIAHDYDAVFLINQDAWIHPKCLQNLLNEDYGGKVGIVSPMHYDGTEQHLDCGFAEYIQNVQTDAVYVNVPFVNAAFWLIPIEVVTQVGSFSPIFYHYGEDTDYGNRIQHYGLRTVVNTRAKAYHDRQVRQSLTKAQFFKREYIYFLTEYANINYSFVQAFGYGVLAPIKKAFQSSSKSTFNSVGAYLQIAFRVLMQSVAVAKTRRKNSVLRKPDTAQ